MKALVAAAAFALTLTACGGDGDDALAERAEESAENRAEALETMADTSTGAEADALDARADQVEDMGEARAEAIDNSDVDVDTLTEAQKNAMIEGR